MSSLSSLSLAGPGAPENSNRRRLLLVYIHGFMGSEASFQDLPAHIHDLLAGLLSESHVVYTRIYPRYKSHGEIQTAVAQFSAWLSPHEADDLDVILLGHSLGGILAADVALLQKHRILGLVNFDVPLLGIHPRVIPTGASGSIPKKGPAFDDKLAGEEECLDFKPPANPVPFNPNFDPPFRNDVRLVERGFLKGMMHFVNKNTDNLSRSIVDRLVSPLRFANCVNNYSELRRRYRQLRELEAAEYSPRRVRFVNYYTASTGRISHKTKKRPATEPEGLDQTRELTTTPPQVGTPSVPSDVETATSTISNLKLEEHNLKAVPHSPLASEDGSCRRDSSTVDLTSIASSTSADQKSSQTLSESVSLSTSASSPSSDLSRQKLRKFILLPSHHWRHDDNAHWTPVLMEDMDEVLAHQSMFIPRGANYDYLVGDSVGLIEQWVQSDLSRRALEESLD
ncbi:uncharacterized protein BDW47DRAFT_117566 [Aspergillus candidus]|uniref:AB hydrolase-1 domain-containing protein n=1 Tax=Aspergillus candidus TaxID=41067 RepID=A0A2I2FBQ3_ASPCN|nr:hypothetical protein BDW47DRAFT_117566 [Aspergillus candidus]PLB38055.1 hypothetical protein BDW47DRAFT_117566 [Aspergillus candidus]